MKQSQPQRPGNNRRPSSPQMNFKTEIQNLQSQVNKLTKLVNTIYDSLQLKQDLNSFLLGYVGKKIVLEMSEGVTVAGPLMWVDRYNICLSYKSKPQVFNKGHVKSVALT